MPEKEPQKVDEPKSFGGNSSHGRAKRESERGEEGKERPRPRGAAKATASKIPVAKSRRAPFKRVQSSSSSSEQADKKTSSSSEQILSKGSGGENVVTTTTATTTTTNTRVKKVPDFRKLHSKWNKKMERAKKENRSDISVQEFPITPCGKFTPNKPQPRRKEENSSITSTAKTTTVNTERQLSPFKTDSASLHNILHGNGEPPSLSHRATLACGELKIPRDTYRYSMYRRRPAVGPSVPTVNHSKSPGLFASVSHFQGRELLTRLAATTLNSLRTVSKVKHEEETRDIAEFSSIKKSLTFSAEDECGWKVNKSTNSFTDNLSDSQSSRYTSSRRDFRRERVHPELVPKDQFYVLEPELCNLLMSGGGGMAQHCIGGRGQCPSPVAHLLDNVYFVPITNNY